MAIELPKELRAEALASQERYFNENFDERIGNFAASALLSFFIGKPGNAADVIARQAQGGGFDLLVMGTHGHGNQGNLVMGSVATKVLAACKVPALLVR